MVFSILEILMKMVLARLNINLRFRYIYINCLLIQLIMKQKLSNVTVLSTINSDQILQNTTRMVLNIMQLVV